MATTPEGLLQAQPLHLLHETILQKTACVSMHASRRAYSVTAAVRGLTWEKVRVRAVALLALCRESE